MKILNLDPDHYSQKALQLWETVGEVDMLRMNRDKLLECIENYDVLIIRLSHKIDEQVLLRAKKLRIIVTNTTGLDHIDLEKAQNKNIRVVSLRGEREFLETVTSTAEHTWGLLLSLMRQLPQASQSVLQYRWKRQAFVGNDLAGKTLGIIGMGRVGNQVAKMAKAFSMNVLAFDPAPSGTQIHYVDSIESLVSKCDIVTIHAPLNHNTFQMLGEREFSFFRPGAYFINTARGDLIDESALVSVLKSGHLAGAAIDVLSGEPIPSTTNPLLLYATEHSNLLITPHIAGATWDSWEKTEVFVAKIATNILRNQNTLHGMHCK